MHASAPSVLLIGNERTPLLGRPASPPPRLDDQLKVLAEAEPSVYATGFAFIAALYMMWVYEKMSRHSSEGHMPSWISGLFAGDSCAVNGAQFFVFFSDLPDITRSAYSKVHEYSGAGLRGHVAASTSLSVLLGWSLISAATIYSSALAVLPNQPSAVGAWILRDLLIFRSLLKSPQTLQSFVGAAKSGVTYYADGRVKEGLKILAPLTLSALLSLFYTFTQHTAITKGLATMKHYGDMPLGLQATFEAIGTLPLLALSAEFIRKGMDTVLHPGSARFLCSLLIIAGASGFPAVTLALTGVSTEGGAAIPPTAFDFESHNQGYRTAAAVCSYAAASFMNAPGFASACDSAIKKVWPRLKSCVNPVVSSIGAFFASCKRRGPGYSTIAEKGECNDNARSQSPTESNRTVGSL